MDDAARKALEADRLVDITTTGRKSGKPHRKEVRLRQLDGQPYLSNNPGTRDWAANLFANPEFTYHLKQSVQQDLRARATPVRDVEEKRALLTRILEKEEALDTLEARMAGSHLFRVEVLD
ncbi:MAG: nitroreductase/quinone reductase family protein [Chloroflexi bacterium]|nr:nitroreductase/quinone reductase family protein [Chloroflexota bacterium]